MAAHCQGCEHGLTSCLNDRRRDAPGRWPAQAGRLRVEPMSVAQIVPGITMDSSGQATVDQSLADTLFDLAIRLEESTELPVDVQHVLAAIVLAARNGELDPHTPLGSDDSALVEILTPHVETVFGDYEGRVGRDD